MILAQSMMNPTPQINLERRHSQSIFMIYNIIFLRGFSTVYDESNYTDKSREKAFSIEVEKYREQLRPNYPYNFGLTIIIGQLGLV